MMNTQYTSDAFPGTNLQIGSRGSDVLKMQRYLNAIGQYYPSIPQINEDGIFGYQTDQAVRAFQRLFSLQDDGIIGPATWNKIVEVYNGLPSAPDGTMPYPGTPLIVGSSGNPSSTSNASSTAFGRAIPLSRNCRKMGFWR